jgi:hypothetical protein
MKLVGCGDERLPPPMLGGDDVPDLEFAGARLDHLAHGAAIENLSDLKGRHVGLPVIHAAAHVGVDRHEPVANEHLPVLHRIQRGFREIEVAGGGDAGGS